MPKLQNGSKWDSNQPSSIQSMVCTSGMLLHCKTFLLIYHYYNDATGLLHVTIYYVYIMINECFTQSFISCMDEIVQP